MAAILETPSHVHLLGKTAQVGPANMAAANLFDFTFVTTDAQCSLFLRSVILIAYSLQHALRPW